MSLKAETGVAWKRVIWLKMGISLYMLKVVNNTTRYKKNVYSRY